VIELYPSDSQAASGKDKPFVLVLQAGDLLQLREDARLRCDYAIPARTRDVLPVELVQSVGLRAPVEPKATTVNLKRSRAVVGFFRRVVDPSAATLDPSSESSVAAASSSAEIVGEDRKIASIPMSVPSASPSAPAAASSSSAIDASDLGAQLEDLHVKGVYDSIASHFSGTRHSPWPRIETFVKSLPAGSEVADIGCGNGKYMGLNPGINIFGCDNSPNLVRICRETKGYNVVEGDIMSVPFANDRFDTVLCIAVMHHISTETRRVRAVQELIRIAKPGVGRILVSAWAFEQDITSRRSFPSQDVFVPWNIPKRFIQGDAKAEEIAGKTITAAREALKEGDDAASSSSSSSSSSTGSGQTDPSSGAELVQFQRYCHVYKENELEQLFVQQSTEKLKVSIVEKYYDRGNWCVLVKKEIAV
jgi:SAM-dependent methyltransferase